MRKSIKNIINTIVPKKYHLGLTRIKYWLTNGYSTKSYSQEGEDMILRRIFENHKEGFYVDVGAHHPKRFSNTYYFYKNGWRGINIDAMPGSMRAFERVRPLDVNLEAAVSSKKDKLIYYAFDDPALNGFCKDLSFERASKSDYRLLFTKELETIPLKEILNQYVPNGTKIDFLTVDVEGLDLQVLQSNDWNKYRPGIVLVEHFISSLDDFEKDEVSQFMKKKGYSLYAKTSSTVFYLGSKNKQYD